VNVSNGNDEHIGTILANSSEELNKKLKTTLMEHFDADVEFPEVKIEDYIEGRDGTVEIKVDSTFENADEIFICETWIF
jgi:hypothetical protein